MGSCLPYNHNTNNTNIVYSKAIDNAITKLIELNINLLAIDFDQTFIDIHTGGRYKGTVDELIPHVRPEFIQLVQAALSTNSNTSSSEPTTPPKTTSAPTTPSNIPLIHVAIVTFSSQPQLIKNVLEICLGYEYSNMIPIRGGDRSWSYNGPGSKDGKQAHIASAVEEILANNCTTTSTSNNNKTNNDNTDNDNDFNITKASTLLIDDDHKNIRVALNDGTRAIWFNPDKPYLLLQEIAKLV